MEPAVKKLCTEIIVNKHSENDDYRDNCNGEDVNSFKNFQLKRVLNNSGDKCSVAVEGSFGEAHKKAVVLLQKLPFNEENLGDIFAKISDLKVLFKNDIYCNKTAHLPAELNEIKMTTIYPAEEKHIKKYEKEFSSFVNETPELYKMVTYPFIESSSYSKQWIYNILEHKTEVERIVCEDLDPNLGFVMVPDMKWTGEQLENLYLQAIVMKRDLLSIRDLRGKHLPILQNVYDKCTNAIKEKYGVPSSKLRIYVHYQPSYYHLHIHFSALSFDAPGTWSGKAHLLRDIMNNLEIDSEFYKKAVLSFTVKDNDPLKLSYEKNGYFKEN